MFHIKSKGVWYSNKVLVNIGQIPDSFKVTSSPDFVINAKKTGLEDDVLFNGEYNPLIISLSHIIFNIIALVPHLIC